mgnify:CR=1 FL=1
MKIIITGANSFIGRRLIPVFSRLHQVTAVMRENNNLFGQFPNVETLALSMIDYGHLGEMINAPDCFIALAWSGSRGEARNDYALQKFNYSQNLAAMKSMTEAGCKILVSAGSQAEYGIHDEIITEESFCKPESEYGKFKLKLFNDTKEIADEHGIRFIEPRYFSLYGPGDYEKTLIMLCVKKMLDNEVLNLNECRQIWDYMYIDDAVEGLLRLCENDTCSGVYNFASGHNKTLREFVIDIHEALHSKSIINFGAIEYNGAFINLRPSIKKLTEAVNWRPQVSFTQGILRTAESIKKGE